MANDQRGTSFKANLMDLWCALIGTPRRDGRGYVGGVLHELKNIAVELIRQHPAKTALVLLVLAVMLAEWGWSGSLL